LLLALTPSLIWGYSAMSISRLTAAAASATQETTFTLANLNLDFSLFKVEAPVEFRGLGACLSSKRKEEAEIGNIHSTVEQGTDSWVVGKLDVFAKYRHTRK
jgi:hypothetical protein